MKSHRSVIFFGAQQKFNFQPASSFYNWIDAHGSILDFVPRRSSAFGHALLSLPRVIFEFTKQFSSGDLRTVFHVSHGRINKMQKWMFTLHRGHLSYHSFLHGPVLTKTCVLFIRNVFYFKAQVSLFRSHFDREGQGPDH